MNYKVASHIFNITGDKSDTWKRLSWRYEPFVTEEAVPILNITIEPGVIDRDAKQSLEKLYDQPPTNSEETWMRTYRAATGDMIFEVQQPGSKHTNAWLEINPAFDTAKVTVREDDDSVQPWSIETSVTQCIQIAYMLATAPLGTLITHSACIKHDGRAYIFIGKSGTGKSTHARLWLKNIPGAMLLNDDHPIIRADFNTGDVTIYGSPWSGKTHCYINDEAPAGGIVRIQRAPANSICHMSPIEAYASISTSFSGLTWLNALADARHRTLEAIVMYVPNYLMKCLPDDDAAKVCHAGVATH